MPLGKHLIVGLVMLWTCPSAFAEADGPDFLRVDGVKDGNVLNIHRDASQDSPVVGTAPAAADGLRNLGCEGGLTFEEFEKATPAEREKGRLSRWCRIEHGGVEGWAAGWHLVEGTAPSAVSATPETFPVVASVIGPKWYLAGVSDGPAFGEAWIAFAADGSVSGNTGCNGFTGAAKVGDKTISFGPLAATRMACAGSVKNAQEAFLFSLLDGELNYRIEGGMLTIEQPSDGASARFGARPEGQRLLTCSVEAATGLAFEDPAWTPLSPAQRDTFVLTPVPAAPCENDDFTCQSRNPNYQLTSDRMKDDFVGCYRVAGLATMSCDLFTSTLKVNFTKGVFTILDDDGGLIANDATGGSVALYAGRCVPVPE